MTILYTFASGDVVSSSKNNANNTDIAAEITNSLAIDGQSIMSGQIKAANGSASAPSFTFGSDLNTGMYRKGADNVGLAAGGTEVLDITATGASITGTLDISGAVTFTTPIATASIADSAITTAKIADANVTTAKLAAGAVVTASITDANVTTAKIANANVTYAKIQNVADGKVLGNFSGGAAAPSEYSLGKSLTVASTTINFVFNLLAFATWTDDGSTITLRQNYNVASVTRVGSGSSTRYAIAFTNNTIDIYYTVQGAGRRSGLNGNGFAIDSAADPAITGFTCCFPDNNGNTNAQAWASITVFGN